MTSLYGANYTNAYVDVPASPYPAGEHNGKVRVLYDSYTLPSAIVAANDTISIGKLPAGARVINAQIFIPASMGATGIFDVGYAANGVDSADPNAFILAADAGGQAVLGVPTLGSVGLFKKFSVETEIIITCTELTVATSGIIHCAIEYIMD